jgi:hypothetical protein
VGVASGDLKKQTYVGCRSGKRRDQKYSMKLEGFFRVDPSITAAEIKRITACDYRFGPTMFALYENEGPKLLAVAQKRAH